MISSVQNTQAQVLGGLSATSNLMAETEDRFLTLLITQLKNQDPLNPMDNAGLTSQIAQLSTVNGITQLNQTLLALSGQIDMSAAMQAANLIGRDVLVPGDRIALGNGVTTPAGIEIEAPAKQVTVEVVDRAGKVLRSYDLGEQNTGLTAFQWDGRDQAGAAMPDGAYYVRVAATDSTGAAVPVTTLTYAQVAAVDYGRNGVQLDLGLLGKADLGDIRKVL